MKFAFSLFAVNAGRGKRASLSLNLTQTAHGAIQQW